MKHLITLLIVCAMLGAAFAQLKNPTAVVAPTFVHTNGPAAIGQVLTATSTAGAMAWSNGLASSIGSRFIVFATGTSLGGTNMFTFSHTNGTVDLINYETERGLRLNADGLQQSFSGVDLYFGVSAKTNAWYIEGDTATITFGSWLPGSSNVVSLGSSIATASNVWANDIYAVNSMNIRGSGGAIVGLKDADGTNVNLRIPNMDGFDAEFRWFKNTNAGVMVSLSETGTNQMTTITLSAGQVVGHNGTMYVATNAIIGATNGGNAAAGYIGESFFAAVTNITAGPNNVNTNATSIALTPGDWDVSAIMMFDRNSVTFTGTLLYTAVSFTSGNAFDGEENGINAGSAQNSVSDTFTKYTASIPSFRMSIPTNATVYLKSFVGGYATGSPKITGRISARRMR